MKRFRAAVTIGLFAATLCPTFSFGWSCLQDNKPADELNLMRDYELPSEAQPACIHAAIIQQYLNRQPNLARIDEYQNLAQLDKMSRVQLDDQLRLVLLRNERDRVSVALEYIETVGRVARKKNGGIEPEWVGGMTSAVTGGHPLACVTFHNRVPNGKKK